MEFTDVYVVHEKISTILWFLRVGQGHSSFKILEFHFLKVVAFN